MLNFKNILYPIDLDTDNISSLMKALEFAKMFKSQIHILYVNDMQAGYRHPTDHEDEVALRVKEVVPPELLENQKIIYAVSKGSLDKEIVKYCGNNNIDLIITGHKHRNKLYSNLFDSPDENIIDAIKLPVLVIPEN
jgi:Universal stress protein UspA and related nucleotide-binding proteins